jgi:hypothetical protein
VSASLTHFAGLHFPAAAATVSTAAACRQCLCFRSYIAIIFTDAAISVATAATCSPGAAVYRAAFKVVSSPRRASTIDQLTSVRLIVANSAVRTTSFPTTLGLNKLFRCHVHPYNGMHH